MKELSPSQLHAWEEIQNHLTIGQVCLVQAEAGMGKTLLAHKCVERGGLVIGARELVQASAAALPGALEEALLELLDHAVAANRLVVFDDFHLIADMCMCWSYDRRTIFEAAMVAVLDRAAQLETKLVFITSQNAPAALRARSLTVKIGDFKARDYYAICADLADLDWDAVHRFAPKLNGHQLRNAMARVGSNATTDIVIEDLRAHDLVSNVDLKEVAPVSWADLKGADEVIAALEAKIALPFENETLAAQLGLKPKRGVLLAGPPGTGKTTIGRALAHRLKGKFFLIDGTFVAGARDFQQEVEEIFDNAKRNAPSIVFIDDADVIFDKDAQPGFYRYLLTVLDGLESASLGRVCVMMTAMNAGALPAALLRSGRVELWLETKPPSEGARVEILRDAIGNLPGPLGTVDLWRLASLSKGLTGADLKAGVEDAKLLYARDVSRQEARDITEDYFEEALAVIRSNKRSYKRSKPAEMAEVNFGYFCA